MQGRIRQLVIFCCVVSLVAVTAYSALLYLWRQPVHWSKASLIVQPGMGQSTLSYRVARLNDHYPLWLTRLLIKAMSSSHRLHYGEYSLKADLSLNQLFNHMDQQTGMVQHQLTLIEGWTFSQVKQSLLANNTLRHIDLNVPDKTLMTALGDPTANPEGQFYPDSYRYVWGNSSLKILQQSHALMQQVLAEEWADRASGLLYSSPYQALIVASLIEVETPTKSERPLVAGVILQRLKQGMRLQIDPTVLYGLGKPYGAPITKKDLATMTPYNTYRHSGLPPTPIDMPSRSSIHAAMHPVFKGYLYYVSKGDGTHTFSKTYAEHQQGVQRYRRFEKSLQQQPSQATFNQQLLPFDWRWFMMHGIQWI